METRSTGVWEDSIGADLDRVLFTEEEIQNKINEIGQEIMRDYGDRRPLLVGILNGCIPFIADLVRAIRGYVEIDFMSVSWERCQPPGEEAALNGLSGG